MLDSNPILRERLLAIAAFGAIAIGSATAVDTMVTGGFDFPVARDAAHSASAPVLAMADGWTVTPRAEPVSWIADPPPTEDAPANDALDGGALAEAAPTEPTEAEIYEEIRALYEDAEPAPEDNAITAEDAEPFEGKVASAYESASPW